MHLFICPDNENLGMAAHLVIHGPAESIVCLGRSQQGHSAQSWVVWLNAKPRWNIRCNVMAVVHQKSKLAMVMKRTEVKERPNKKGCLEEYRKLFVFIPSRGGHIYVYSPKLFQTF